MIQNVFPVCQHIYSREARPSAPAWNIAKTLIQAFTLWAIFLGAIPALIYIIEEHSGISAWRYTDSYLQAIAVALFIVCGLFALYSGVILAIQGQGTPLPFDTARKLVIRGPYRYVRNPMSLGSITQGLAVGLFLGSPMVMLYALTGYLYWEYLLRPWEEMDLEKRFGTDYVAYRDAVPCWTPRFHAYDYDIEAIRDE